MFDGFGRAWLDCRCEWLSLAGQVTCAAWVGLREKMEENLEGVDFAPMNATSGRLA